MLIIRLVKVLNLILKGETFEAEKVLIYIITYMLKDENKEYNTNYTLEFDFEKGYVIKE